MLRISECKEYLFGNKANKQKQTKHFRSTGGHTPEVYKEMSSGRRVTLETLLGRDVVVGGTISLLLFDGQEDE